MGSVEGYQIGLFIYETIGFFLNLLAIYVFSRLGLKEMDMWLGTIMAIFDLLLTGFEIAGTIGTLATGEKFFGHNETFEVFASGFMVFLAVATLSCILFLGIIRWLVICKGYELKKLNKLTLLFSFDVSISIILFVGCIVTGGFRQVDIKNYYYPDFHHVNLWATIWRVYIISHFMCCFFVVNYCYVSIAWNYIDKLNTHAKHYGKEHEIVFKREKRGVLLKIGVMLFLYNLALLPFCLVDLIELATVQKRNMIIGKLAFLSIDLNVLINPAMLITMHCDTWKHVRNIFRPEKEKKAIPYITEVNVDTKTMSKSQYTQ